MSKLLKYLFNLLVALDRGINAILGGDPAMTLSGRMGKAIAAGKCRVCWLICRALDYIRPGHCAQQARNEANLGADEVLR